MSIEIMWNNPEQTIIYCKFHVGWGWQNLYDTFSQLHALIESVPNDVDVIADISEASNLPSNPVAQFGAIAKKLPTHMRIFVVVADSMFIDVMVKMFKQLHPIGEKVLIAKTLEKAHIRLQHNNYSDNLL